MMMVMMMMMIMVNIAVYILDDINLEGSVRSPIFEGTSSPKNIHRFLSALGVLNL